MKQHCVISLSGGMDSSTLLLRCLKEYDTVTAVSFDYGQKHKVELEKAQSLISYLCNNDIGIANSIQYRIIKLEGLSDLLNSALVEGGKEVPEGHYEEENMKLTVVPNRNKIFASIIQSIALSIAEKTGEECDIALGVHAGDFSIYPDCRQEFRDADEIAFREGNWGNEKVNYYTPYLKILKKDILKDGAKLCKVMSIDFNEMYKRTLTSYKPILHNGVWYSDYKSASSIERIEAFIIIGTPDPILYANSEGPVEWCEVKNYVEKVLKKHNK